MRITVVLLVTCLAGPAAAAAPSSQPSSRPASQPASRTAADLLTPAQLRQDEQALGWWLGGSGTVGILAGAFGLLVAKDGPAGPTHELEMATSTAFTGLGVALLVAGIYVMASADPGPCETDGTALRSGAAVWRF